LPITEITNLGVDFDLSKLDWSASTDEAVAPIKRRRIAGKSSRVIDHVGVVHAADGSMEAALVDLAVLCAVALVFAVVPMWFRVSFPFAVVAAGYIGQVYAGRDSVASRGVLWYPSRLVAPIMAVATIPVALGLAGVTAAVTLALGSFAALVGLRCLTWMVLMFARRKGLGLRRTLIIGDAKPAATVWRRLVEFPEAGLLPTQLLSFEQARTPGAVQHSLDQWSIGHVVLVAPSPQDAEVTGSLPRQRQAAPYFSAVPALTELFLDPRSVTEVGGIPLIPLGRLTQLRHRFPGKRAFDILAASLLLICAAPVLAAIAVAVKVGDGGPVLFRQPRVGRNGELFGFWKFRTMVVGADKMLDELMADNITDGLLYKFRSDPRITRVGGFLRKTSLDELPQLWNVLCGQMSMVGPRPLAVEPHAFSPGDSERHSVLPGITGYWQLSGGPELSYDEMIRLDLAYIRNWSLWLDLRLVLRTSPALLHRHGAS
jgi:exopolysaccharide biosynthesis polyprenyl glycosylphosphotransferase